MNHILSPLRATLLIIAVFFSASSLAELKEGDAVELPQLADQFDAKYTLGKSTKWLLFSHDMDGTKIIRSSLEGQTAETLEAKGIQVYADISGMPGFVARFIALPKLKKLPYPMALARDAELLQSIPREEDKGTALQMEQGKVTSISIVTSTEQVKTLLGL